MNKVYLVLVNGKLAKRRLSYAFALKDQRELLERGFKNVSVAYEITKEVHSND